MKKRNLNLFYAHQIFFAISEGILPFALVLHIYGLFGSISAIFFFNAAWSLMYLFAFLPTFNMAQKLGRPKYFMALGMIFYVIALALFGLTTKENLLMIIPTTLFFTAYVAFYWPTRHWFFSVITDFEKMGKQVSNLWAIMLVISVISPIIGGAVAFYYSFNAAFWIGSAAGIGAVVPILFFHAPPHETRYKISNVIKILKKPELSGIRWAYIWEGISQFSFSIGWTLIFTIYIGNVKDLGVLIGVSTLIAAVLSKITGRWFDARKRLKLLKRITVARSLTSLAYLSIFFFPNFAYIYVVQSLEKFSTTMSQTVNDSYLYSYSNKIHPMYFHINRESFLTISRLITNLVFGIIFLFLPAIYLWALIAIGGFAFLGWLQVGKNDHLLHQ